MSKSPYPGEPVYFTCAVCLRLRHKSLVCWRGNKMVCQQCVEAPP